MKTRMKLLQNFNFANGTNIHTQVANVAYKLANESGLVENSNTDETYGGILKGATEWVDKNIFDTFIDIFDKIEDEDGFEAPPGYSLGHFIDEKFEKYSSK